MSDIWSNLGSNIAAPKSDGWLYREGGEIHGPMPEETIVKKLISGEIGPKTPVAREGGDFHPAAQVAAFEPHMASIKKGAKKRAAAKRRKLLFLLALPILGGLAAGGYFIKVELDQREAQRLIDLKKAEEAAALKREEIAKVLKGPKVKPIALVEFDQSQMKVGGTRRTTGGSSTKSTGSTSSSSKDPDVGFSSCQRSQGQIFGTLGKHIGKINVCVQDEKARDKSGLLPSTLTLEFVVTPTGKVTNFAVQHRHYRKGPMNNCMIKAFSRIRFTQAGGSNCPVAIPIKIGG